MDQEPTALGVPAASTALAVTTVPVDRNAVAMITAEIPVQDFALVISTG